MSVQASDIKFRKSVVVTDTTANGGRKGQVEVVSGARHNLFPRVSKAERTAGVTRYRKEFWCNESAADYVAYDVLVFLEFPSNGGDRFAIGKGSQIDTQSNIVASPLDWVGCGSLEVALSGGETEVQLAMEGTDFAFLNGGYLHLTNKFDTGQTVDADVDVGDSVTYSGGTWSKIASTDDIVYPNGLCVGSTVIMTTKDATHEEWLSLKDYLYSDEDIGDGNGANVTPALTNLLHGTNGICSQSGKLPVVTAVCGGSSRTINIASDGTCSGYCSAGELNMADGTWTADITWTSAPDNLVDITITYRENCFKYTGNVATVYLDEQVANAYLTANSYGSGCLFSSEVKPTSESWAESSVAGTYDEATYPLVLYNDGAERDSWTLTFTSAMAFTCSGANEGSVGSGSISADFSPTNPNTSQPYFTIDKDGWGGSWLSGNTITFTTNPSAIPIWWREIVPSATAQESNNLTVLGFYCE
jgi:hypothetical protein